MLCGNRHRCTSDLSIQSNKRVLYNILHNIVFNAQTRERGLTQTVWRRTMSWHIWHTRFLEGLVSAYQFQGICSNLILQLFGTKSPNISISTFWENPVLWSWFLWGPNPTNRRTRCRWHNGGILLDRWHLRGYHSLRRPGDVVIWEGRRLLLLLCQVHVMHVNMWHIHIYTMIEDLWYEIWRPAILQSWQNANMIMSYHQKVKE